MKKKSKSKRSRRLFLRIVTICTIWVYCPFFDKTIAANLQIRGKTGMDFWLNMQAI